jgi:hypothetical protein
MLEKRSDGSYGRAEVELSRLLKPNTLS